MYKNINDKKLDFFTQLLLAIYMSAQDNETQGLQGSNEEMQDRGGGFVDRVHDYIEETWNFILDIPWHFW